MQISKYSVTSSSDPEIEQSSYVVFKYLLMWRIEVVYGSSQGGPNGPGGGGGGGGSGLKVTVSSNSKHILWSRGFRIVQMVHMAPWGPGEGPHSFSNWWHTPRCTTGSLRQFRWALSPLGLLFQIKPVPKFVGLYVDIFLYERYNQFIAQAYSTVGVHIQNNNKFLPIIPDPLWRK